MTHRSDHIAMQFREPSGAVFSECRKYRYLLWRFWDRSRPPLGWIALNPSTADEVKDDPTVSRCIIRSGRLGYGGIVLGNIYGYRATDPAEMERQADPVGMANDAALLHIARFCPVVVCAWGNHATIGRQELVVGMLRAMQKPPTLKHLGMTKTGRPKHPLYIGYSKELEEWK